MDECRSSGSQQPCLAAGLDHQEQEQHLIDHEPLDDPVRPQQQGLSTLPPQEYASKILLRLCILILFLDSANYLSTAPLTQTYESIICSEYYADVSAHSVDGSYGNCKIGSIQEQVAFIIGWKVSIGQIPSGSK